MLKCLVSWLLCLWSAVAGLEPLPRGGSLFHSLGIAKFPQVLFYKFSSIAGMNEVIPAVEADKNLNNEFLHFLLFFETK